MRWLHERILDSPVQDYSWLFARIMVTTSAGLLVSVCKCCAAKCSLTLLIQAIVPAVYLCLGQQPQAAVFPCRYGGQAVSKGELTFTQVLKV